MEYIVRTAAGAELQTNLLLKKPHTLRPNSTLNEKFNSNAGLSLNSNEVPSLYCFGVGNGGHKMTIGVNNISKNEPVQHLPRHAALYNHIPLVLRPINSDLTATERLNYRMRVMETYDGVPYVAYYLKVMDLSQTQTQLQLRTVVNDVTQSTPFEYSLSDLNPTPPAISPNLNAIYTTGDYLAASAIAPILLTNLDVAEFLNAVTIIYGDDSYGIVSEICLVSGIDRTVSGNFNGSNASYTDIIGAQIFTFLNCFQYLKYQNAGVRININVGAVEPLLNLTTINTV